MAAYTPAGSPFLVRVHATSGPKLITEEPRPKAYYQLIGVTAKDEKDLAEVVRQHVERDTGGELLGIDDIAVPDLEGADSDIRDLCGDLGKRGVWYVSGYAFHCD